MGSTFWLNKPCSKAPISELRRSQKSSRSVSVSEKTYTIGLAVNYPPLLIVDFFVDSCLQYFLSDFERNCRSLIWKMIICRLKSTIVEFSKITKVLIVETKLIVDRLLRKRKFVDISLQILICSCIYLGPVSSKFSPAAL